MKAILFLLFVIMSVHNVTAQNFIIPKPSRMEIKQDSPFVLDSQTTIITDPALAGEGKLLKDMLKKYTGYDLRIIKQTSGIKNNNTISLAKSKNKEAYPAESYSVTANMNTVVITGSTPSGIFYGGITLLQLIKQDTAMKKRYVLPAVSIFDNPRFAWRGLMLDCSRTFLSPGYLKRTIDRMSFYKLNTLHLHLTDDQGWRLEIKKRPLLTSKGAFFAENYHEPKDFEGFYTQEQMKDIIRFAAERHIRIIPEIEAPGHSSAAIHAYPDLSCSGKSAPVYPLLSGSPVPPNDVFCAGNEETYRLFNDVVQEVTSLFPSSFIHFGGDEVSKHHWEKCSKCQNKIVQEKLANENELQRYLMQRISETAINSGKRPIGWDEVLDGNIGKKWLIMAWRPEEKGIEAAKKGYDVVLTPTSHLYFDYRYITTPTSKVYSYEPISDTVSAEITKHVLGIQANFWSHVERTESRIDFMLFPRLLALSERAWSDRSVKDYADFRVRKEYHLNWLKFFDIKYNGNDDPERSPWDLVW